MFLLFYFSKLVVKSFNWRYVVVLSRPLYNFMVSTYW